MHFTSVAVAGSPGSRVVAWLLGAVVAALAFTACNSGSTQTPTAPTTPTNVTETFSGTINQNGAVTHAFTTTTSGTLSATLSVLGPDSAQVIGMSLGTLSGTTCTTVLSNDRSTQGTVITGGVSSLGSLCVRAYDVGSITAAEPFTYEITVVHP